MTFRDAILCTLFHYCLCLILASKGSERTKRSFDLVLYCLSDRIGMRIILSRKITVCEAVNGHNGSSSRTTQRTDDIERSDLHLGGKRSSLFVFTVRNLFYPCEKGIQSYRDTHANFGNLTYATICLPCSSNQCAGYINIGYRRETIGY
jgi:hypothetical protein